MTITLDQPLGSAINAIGAATLVLTTSQPAAAGSRIVICVSWFDTGGNTVTVSDGTAYVKDKQFDNGSDHFAVFSRVLGGSLASSSNITVTWGGTTGIGGQLAAACSYRGTTGVDTTATNATTGTGFSSGAAANSIADALFVGGAGNETTTPGSVGGTNTNGTSRFDIWSSGPGQGMRMLDKIASSVGSQALTGTWAVTSTATTGVLVIYKGGAASPQPVFLPRNTLGRGVRNQGQMALFAERIPKTTPAAAPAVPLWVPTYISPNGTFY